MDTYISSLFAQTPLEINSICDKLNSLEPSVSDNWVVCKDLTTDFNLENLLLFVKHNTWFNLPLKIKSHEDWLSYLLQWYK